MHLHKKVQGLGKHVKALNVDQKNKLLLRVGGGMYASEKSPQQPSPKQYILQTAIVRRALPTLLYRL